MMKKIAVHTAALRRVPLVALGSMITLLLGACLPLFTPTPGAQPAVDTAGTATALFNLAVADTLTAQPTFTVVSVTDTAAPPTVTPVLPPADSPTAVETVTPVANLTTTPATATGGALDPAATNATFTATLAPGQVTASPTLGIRLYGTLPPLVPSSHVTLINRSEAEAYISLQVTMKEDKHSILEYPVEKRVEIDAPVGSYLYVAWVGGRKMVGNFRLYENDDLTITLYKNKVVIK
jgi:hypothetical protein